MNKMIPLTLLAIMVGFMLWLVYIKKADRCIPAYVQQTYSEQA